MEEFAGGKGYVRGGLYQLSSAGCTCDSVGESRLCLPVVVYARVAVDATDSDRATAVAVECFGGSHSQPGTGSAGSSSDSPMLRGMEGGPFADGVPHLIDNVAGSRGLAPGGA